MSKQQIEADERVEFGPLTLKVKPETALALKAAWKGYGDKDFNYVVSDVLDLLIGCVNDGIVAQAGWMREKGGR